MHRRAARGDVAAAFLHADSIAVALLHTGSIAAALLRAGSVAAAFLHAGSIAVALLRAARALSVQKRYANEWDVQKRHGSEQGGGRCGARGVSAASEAVRRGGTARRAGRHSEESGSAKRGVSAAKSARVRGHAGAWGARAGTRRSGLRLACGDTRPRGRRAGTRPPGGFSSRGERAHEHRVKQGSRSCLAPWETSRSRVRPTESMRERCDISAFDSAPKGPLRR